MESKPTHPGPVVRDRCLARHGLTVAEGARVLGITRQALNNLVNQKSGISPDMAIRLAKAFGGDEEYWLQLQLSYDLALARKRADRIAVQKVAAVPQPAKQAKPF